MKYLFAFFGILGVILIFVLMNPRLIDAWFRMIIEKIMM